MKNACKLHYLLILFFSCFYFSVFAQSIPTANDRVPPYTESFGYGSNMGYYSGWNDNKIADVISGAGANTLRATLPDNFLETWGTNVRLEAFAHYSTELGMKNIVCFIEGPSSAHQDPTSYPGNTQSSKLFANLYEPIWNEDGSVNQNNYYAYYVYKLVQAYGKYINIWEVVNEPDFTWNADVSQWLTRAPLPSEMANVLAPFYHYIRMLRITWEVIKKYNPDDYVTPGGIGYDTFLDALLRYTDNPTDGSATSQYPNKGGAYFDIVSFHDYPGYSLRYWNNSIGNFSYIRNSDYAAAEVINQRNRMEAVLEKYGYNGAVYPKKYLIITETNVSRRTVDWRYGSDEMQRNFGMKALVLAQKNDIKQVHIFGVAESINAPSPATVISSSDEYGLMGLYENLNRDAPGSQKLTQLGTGYKTTSQVLNGYTYDAARTNAMNLPADVEGGAFSKNGDYVYVLWAKNPSDATEVFSAAYSFPAAWNLYIAERKEWDYSSTGTSTRQSSKAITLSSAPSFFQLLPSDPLPIMLVNFSGQLQNDHVLLRWSTNSEHNSSGFEIQRSSDGNDFSNIAFVPAAGNSSSVQQYQYTDTQPGSDKNYYRLKMMDKDGQFKLSNVIFVSKEGAVQNISVVNPFNDKIELQLTKFPVGKVVVDLFDLSGKRIGTKEFSNNTQVVLRFNNRLGLLSKGVYVLRINADQKEFRMKLVKQ